MLPEVARTAEAISFSREIRPILSEYCFSCHGPDEQGREAGPDVLGVKYYVTAEPTFDFRNKDDEELAGLWRVTVRAEWTEQGEKQEWQESHLRYQP